MKSDVILSEIPRSVIENRIVNIRFSGQDFEILPTLLDKNPTAKQSVVIRSTVRIMAAIYALKARKVWAGIAVSSYAIWKIYLLVGVSGLALLTLALIAIRWGHEYP